MAEGATIRDEGEHAFLARLCERLRTGSAASPSGVRSPVADGRSAPPVLVGPGDDAAVVGPVPFPLAITTDALVEDVHFRSGWLSPAELGRRAIAVNVSDLAAMAARPAFTLAAVAAPGTLSSGVLDAILDGCAAASAGAGAVLIGGNLTRGDRLSVTVTAIGTVEGPTLTRSGALPGDALLVTGDLGGAAAAVAAWSSGGQPSPALRGRFAAPPDRTAVARALAEAGARAAIDVSDGLIADLGHLCRASGVGAVIDSAELPRLPEVAALDAAGHSFAATGGEDYEILFACPPELVERMREIAAGCGVPLRRIGGCVEPGAGVELVAPDGRPLPAATRGFDHFAATDARPERPR